MFSIFLILIVSLYTNALFVDIGFAVIEKKVLSPKCETEQSQKQLEECVASGKVSVLF